MAVGRTNELNGCYYKAATRFSSLFLLFNFCINFDWGIFIFWGHNFCLGKADLLARIFPALIIMPCNKSIFNVAREESHETNGVDVPFWNSTIQLLHLTFIRKQVQGRRNYNVGNCWRLDKWLVLMLCFWYWVNRTGCLALALTVCDFLCVNVVPDIQLFV